jgi:hypothetical protein
MATILLVLPSRNETSSHLEIGDEPLREAVEHGLICHQDDPKYPLESARPVAALARRLS